MPYSLRENNQDVIDFVRENQIKTVLDVGPGCGTYARLLKDEGVRLDAVEIYEPYVDIFNLRDWYDEVYVEDVRTFDPHMESYYDLVIFGDVLEHMTEAEAEKVWTTAHDWARYGMISVPVVPWPQHAHEGGNPHEAHVQEDISPDFIRGTFGPFVFDRVYDMTGTFIRRFE